MIYSSRDHLSSKRDHTRRVRLRVLQEPAPPQRKAKQLGEQALRTHFTQAIRISSPGCGHAPMVVLVAFRGWVAAGPDGQVGNLSPVGDMEVPRISLGIQSSTVK